MKENTPIIRHNLHSFLSSTVCGIQISALIEITTFLIGGLLIDHLIGDGTHFLNLSLHPFWIILLLITVQYGAKEALLCALACSAFLLIGNMPAQQITENSYDYLFRVIHLPLLWVSTATVLGAIRSRHLQQKESLEENFDNAQERSETITKAYQHLKAAKERLELRLAEEQNSSLVIYEAAKTLETIDQRQLLKSVKNIVITTLNPTKFSIYALQQTGLESIACCGWEKHDNYTMTFHPNTDIYKTMIKNKRVLCVINEEDEKILANQGVLAGPIIDINTKEIFGMLKIEETGVLGISMRNIEIFKILCEWIGMAYSNAQKYHIANNSRNILNLAANNPIKDISYYAKTTVAN